MRHCSGAGGLVQKMLSGLCATGLLVSTTFAQTNPAGPLPPAPAGPQQSPPQTIAQQAQAAAQPQPYQGPFHIELPHSRNPLARYMPSTVPELNLQNSQRLYDLIQDGKLRISLQDAIALALENNLTLASFRYNFPIAQADLLRTKAGGNVNGVNTAVVSTTQIHSGDTWNVIPQECVLRGTVRTFLAGYDVYVTDWANARDVSIFEGRFGLADPML